MERSHSRAQRLPLNRTKSASSVCTAPSRPIVQDHFITRLQAETAACEAYRRSQEIERMHEMTPAASHNRTHKRNKFEGSHFEEARLSRRRSMNSNAMNKRSHLGRNLSQRQQAKSSPGYAHSHTNGSTVLSSTVSQSATGQQARLTTYPLPASQKITTVTAQGSPTPRRKPVPAAIHPTPPPLRHVQQFSYENGPSSESLSVVGHGHTNQLLSQHASSRARAQSSPIQQEKVRNRKSFLLESVQKLRKRSSTVHKAGAFDQDKSVPPFNLADQGFTLAPPSAADDQHDTAVAQASSIQTGKVRLLSFAVKDRIKQFIKRPTSRAHGDLPPQHIPATQAHYTSNGSISSSQRANTIQRHTVASQDEPSRSRTTSNARDEEERSRVTSWTNSTITQATRTQSATDNVDQVTEHGMLHRSSNSQRLRSRASFFGRSVNNKLRRTSKPDPSVSKESQGLYTALQHLIHSSSRRQQCSDDENCKIIAAVGPDQVMDVPPPPPIHEYMLQRPRATSVFMPSIRAVTPDRQHILERTMSPLVEVGSPAAFNRHGFETPVNASHSQEAYARTNQTLETRPSPERIALRLKQSQNRWQDALDISQHRCAELERNPYELSAVERHMVADTKYAVDEKQHHNASPVDPRAPSNALSPSIYSRSSEGSMRDATSETPPRTSVTITGREVRSYKISPARAERPVSAEHPIKVSSEWRRWLSGELRDFSNAMSISKPFEAASNEVASTSTGARSPSDVCDMAESSCTLEKSSTQTSNDVKVLTRSRPLASNRRRSSFMNERYPTIESSRSSSRQSGQRSRTSATTARSSSALAEGSTSTRTAQNVMNVGRHKSLADMVNELRTKSAMNSQDGDLLKPNYEADQGHKDSYQHAAAINETKRPQSNIELRARFKSSLSENARPVDIRRKSAVSTLMLPNDDTLRKISAGPYASDITLDAHSTNKRENTPPVKLSGDALPILSSSEWLAGPSMKQQGSVETLNVAAPKSSSKSLSSSPGAIKVGKPPSPGHRLATGWLKERISAGYGSVFV